MSAHGHRKHAPAQVRCAVVPVSDTRTPETDPSGARIKALLDEAGHPLIGY
jgi:molybdenum cofactor biosynthesis protein B